MPKKAVLTKPRFARKLGVYYDKIADYERRLICSILDVHNGSVYETAKELGLRASTLYQCCYRLGIRTMPPSLKKRYVPREETPRS